MPYHQIPVRHISRVCRPNHPISKALFTKLRPHQRGAVTRLVLATVLTIFFSNMTHAQPKIQNIAGENVYSPELLVQGSEVKMYFGGWRENDQVNDAIYRADCGHPHLACTNIQKVIDPVSNGFEHLNDPSIVHHPGGYYIMYMTGVLLGQNGFDVPNNRIYYSTSWDDDGITWSKPQLVMDGGWVPSATIIDGEIYLYVNGTRPGDYFLARYHLGPTGVTVGSPEPINAPHNYYNVHVEYRPELDNGRGLHRIFGERYRVDTSDETVIDYLTSADGLSWNLNKSEAIVADPSFDRVLTPAPDPLADGWIYFGQQVEGNALDNNIYYQSM